MSKRTICVTGDPALRRLLRRTLSAIGSTVEFVGTPEEVRALPEPMADIILIDHATPNREQIERLMVEHPASVIVLGENLDQKDVLDLLRSQRCNNLIGRELDVDEGEVVVTAIKIMSHDIFGLEKYLTWGVPVKDRLVADYDQKRAAIGEAAAYAKEVGCRRPIIARIETVCDELLMNALYDAPAASNGRAEEPVTPALVRYACDGRFFALSVRDAYGALRKQNILDNLERAKDEQGSPRAPDPTGASGAGLGLYFILSSTTRFIANIEPGRATEVICLFDVRANARDFPQRAKSLNIFMAA